MLRAISSDTVTSRKWVGSDLHVARVGGHLASDAAVGAVGGVIATICSRMAAITASMRRWLASIAARSRVTIFVHRTRNCSNPLEELFAQFAIGRAEQHVLMATFVHPLLKHLGQSAFVGMTATARPEGPWPVRCFLR